MSLDSYKKSRLEKNKNKIKKGERGRKKERRQNIGQTNSTRFARQSRGGQRKRETEVQQKTGAGG